MIALYSIKPFYTDQILQGKKKYELRKKLPANEIDYILIYSSRPISKIIGYAEIVKTHQNSVSSIWNLVSDSAGISKKNYLSYFNNCEVAFAFEFGEIKKFTIPLNIEELNYIPPQSFRYIKYNEFIQIISRESTQVHSA